MSAPDHDAQTKHQNRMHTITMRFAYTGIRVRDMAASIRFYTELFGMEMVSPLEATPPTQGQVVTLRCPDSGQLLELNWYSPRSRFGMAYVNGEDLDHLAFECKDVAAEVQRLRDGGVEVIIHPKEIGGWNEVFIRDPNGIWIELVPRKA